MKKILLPLLFACALGTTVQAQKDPVAIVYPRNYAEEAADETNPLILERLDEWQDLKFGFMAHWGMYSQWGVVESWSICNEPWITRNGANYMEYVMSYRNLNRTFNPTRFDAKRWAKAASEAGMKYMVFTTKHHDGFCMFDSKYTDYTIADKSCPYSRHAPHDVTAELVEAFRAKGMWTGLYFSKPDWHCPDYWAPEWAFPDRNVNYDPTDYPERWEAYCQFTYNQIYELTHNYGYIDILWLDGGWVRPEWSINDETRPWLGCKGYVQDVNMPRIAKMARENNPNLLIVDRSVGGKYENYHTPEQQVPDHYLDYPWETCMTMGDAWSYMKDDNYKTTNYLIHTLCDVVAKGGNFLLNVGPDQYGAIPDTALLRMRQIGQWLKVNSIGIYNTRPIAPYVSSKWRFTRSKDNQTVYAIYLLDEGETMPEVVNLPLLDRTPTHATVVGGGTIKIRTENNHTKLYVHPTKGYAHAVVIALNFDQKRRR